MNLLIYEQVENALASGRHQRATSALLQTDCVHQPVYRTVFDGFTECCILWTPVPSVSIRPQRFGENVEWEVKLR